MEGTSWNLFNLREINIQNDFYENVGNKVFLTTLQQTLKNTKKVLAFRVP